MTDPLETKLSQLQKLMRAEDWRAAISFAAKFPRLGKHKSVITRANEAVLRPSFQEQLGKCPQTLIDAGIQALKERYGGSNG